MAGRIPACEDRGENFAGIHNIGRKENASVAEGSCPRVMVLNFSQQNLQGVKQEEPIFSETLHPHRSVYVERVEGYLYEHLVNEPPCACLCRSRST